MRNPFPVFLERRMPSILIISLAVAMAAVLLLQWSWVQTMLSVMLYVIVSLAGLVLGFALVLSKGKQTRVVPPPYQPNMANILLTKMMQRDRSKQHASLQRTVVSRNVDQALREVFDLVLRDYVVVWFEDLCQSQARFKDLLMEDIWCVVGNSKIRLANLDIVKLLTYDVVNKLCTHFQDLSLSEVKPGLQDLSTPFLLQSYLQSDERERSFLRQCSEVLLICLLPAKHARCNSVRYLLREVLACQVFKQVIDLLCDPDYINQTLLNFLQYREKLAEEHNKAYMYAATYEEFVKMINQTKDIEALKEIRYRTMTEIMQVTALIDQVTGDHESPSSGKKKKVRNLKRYLNQCKYAKECCEKRIHLLGGPEYKSYEIKEEEESDVIDDIPPEELKEDTSDVQDELQGSEFPHNTSGTWEEMSEKDETDSSAGEQGFNDPQAKLERLDEKLTAKLQELRDAKDALRPDGKAIAKIEHEVNEMKTERRQLEFHIERTDQWWDMIGRWRANICNAEFIVNEEKIEPFFVIVVHISGAIASTDESTTTGWVVMRNLSDFHALHKRLKEYRSWLRERDLPSKRWFRATDQAFLDKARVMLEAYLNEVLADDTLCQSQVLFSFLSPSPDHLKGSVRDKKTRFSISTLLKNLPGGDLLHKQAAVQDSEDLEDAIEDSEGRDGKDSIAEPLYTLLGEIFELRGVTKWLRRTLIAFVQVTFGASIDKQVRESVEWLFSEPMLVYYIHLLRDSLWPGGKLAPAAPDRTEEEKLQTKQQVKQKLLDNMPDMLQSLVGQQNARRGVIKVFEGLQDKTINKHLFYVLLEMFLVEVCVELRDPQLLAQVAEAARVQSESVANTQEEEPL
ncbi:SNX25 [Branchiostoma lanceolatum]|uniref:SNX25 protein n=1 Tax=Branchiostoma lanceolatum TaxID=7740 RepID=A0A8J9ZWV6_BRALA|nr:SNX25 [Branchiostoma lanceolatum]